MKPILITGATGFLGKYLIEELRARDAGPLRLLCRGTCQWTGKAGIEVVPGDITSSGDVHRAMEGVGSVYHLAGIVSRDPNDASKLYRTHIDGTRYVCEAALRHGVERVLMMSSSGTIAVSRTPEVHDEQSGYKHDIVGPWAYYLSKIYAEKAALSFHAREGLPVIVVNPALLLGPGDDRGSSTGDILWFLQGQFLTMPHGGMSFVDARDCALGVIGAMERGRIGERYLLGGPNWTFRRLINHVAEISGVRPPIMQLSPKLSRAMAPALRKVLPMIGKRFEVDNATIEMSALFWYCDSSKAETELGFKVRDPIETLNETVADLRAREAA